MASFRETRSVLVLAHDQGVIDEEEFVLLCDLNTSENLDYPYRTYSAFDLETICDDECRSYFRFYKADIYRLAEEITCYNHSIFQGLEAFCALLKRFSYPCRYVDMIPRFGRAVPELSMMSNYCLDFIYNNLWSFTSKFQSGVIVLKKTWKNIQT